MKANKISVTVAMRRYPMDATNLNFRTVINKLNLFLLLLMSFASYAQDPCIDKDKDLSPKAQSAKTELLELDKQFKETLETYESAKAELTDMVITLEGDLNVQRDSVAAIRGRLVEIEKKAAAFKVYYKANEVDAGLLDCWHNQYPDFESEEPEVPTDSGDEKTTYILYGDNKIAEEKVFKSPDPKIQAVLTDVFTKDSESCLGTFEIPGNGQKILLYRHKDHLDRKKERLKLRAVNRKNRKIKSEMKADLLWEKNLRFKKYSIGDNYVQDSVPQYVYFDHVKFSVREGRIYDIHVIVKDEKNQEYYFENKIPISMLNYPKASRVNYLVNSVTQSLDKDKTPDSIFDNHYIRISDILTYKPNPGNNFVPDDVEYSFPTGQEDTDTENRRIYMINQKTNLQNVLELRTYTDFLGLFDDSANGIVQVEGSADFFIAPFQVARGTPITIFKKVSPYVHFTRLDEDHRNLITETDPDTDKLILSRPLEVLEKSYLDMGVLVDLFGISIKKEFPFSINLFYSLRYQIASMDSGIPDETLNFKTVGNGAGIRLEFKRFNNFGFNYVPEFTYYNHLNRIETLSNPSNYWVFRNEAEIFYYPGKTKDQSIFLRLRSFINTDDGEDSFFQLQFGYRFMIGMGGVKSK